MYDIILEIITSAFGMWYMIDLVKQKKRCLMVLFVYGVIYAYVLFINKIYLNFLLYSYTAIVGIIGYIRWSKKGNENSNPSFESNKVRFLTIIILIFIYYISYYLQVKYTENSSPILDSVIFSIKIAAIFFVVRKTVEGFFCYIISDGLNIFMMFYSARYIIAFTFILFTIIDIIGFFEWKKKAEIKAEIKN
jgi:nicotinamide mononucleotide transporter